MARDPPALLGSSELRDLDLQPTAVRAVKPTIIHPQLRDLILPLERGKVLYPRAKSLEQHTWNPTGQEPAREPEQWMHDDPTGTTRTFVSLTFTPNCLTASRGIIACGGQHGELYISHLPDEAGKGDEVDAQMRSGGQVPPIRPFSISTTLPTRAINNSLLILPDYPSGWSQRNRSHRAGYIGRRGWQWTVDEQEDEEAGGVDGQSRRDGSSGSHRGLSRRNTPDEEDEDEDAMDVDSDTEGDDAPLESPPFATYPNTVPFLHAPRIPRLSSSHLDAPSVRRRASASAARSTPPCPAAELRSVRAGSSSTRRGSMRYAPEPVLVTSLPHASSSRSASMSSVQRPIMKDGLGNLAAPGKGKRAMREDPRFLVSNNDQSIKMFSLRRTEPPASSERGETSRWSARPSPSVQQAISDRRREWYLDRDVVPPAPFRLGGGYDSWGSIGINEGLRALDPQDALHDLRRMEERYAQPDGTIAPSEMRLRRSVQDFETTLGMRSTAPPPPAASHSLSATIARAQADVAMTERRGATLMGLATMREKEREERKLLKVGGSSFSYAINHSAMSPDLRYMVSVGDSPDVHLFEVVAGGREFRPVAVYKAATDAGFSTAWSKDGRKFAVASQDGQVTVWDHRSWQPLALFYTSPHTPIPRGSSPPNNDSEPERPISPNLVDPVTNSYRTSRSTSGREAARVVKFSPEGSARDLMVFSEENTHIHVVDAKTLTSHVVLRVPVDAISPHVPRTCHQQHGFDAGTWGISGLAFDPTGDWLYAGTERTVVEWDMRRATGGAAEPGVWEMA